MAGEELAGLVSGREWQSDRDAFYGRHEDLVGRAGTGDGRIWLGGRPLPAEGLLECAERGRFDDLPRARAGPLT
jgi:hypothetical protein